LRDVDEIVQKKLAVAPGVGPNDDGVAEADASRIVCEYAGASRRFRQLRIVGQRNPIHHQNSDAVVILNAGPARVCRFAYPQRRAMGENEIFLCFGPLVSKWEKVLKRFLINHAGDAELGVSQEIARGGPGEG
jgi:hypothetical protein